MHSSGCVCVARLPISSYEDRCSLRGPSSFLALNPVCGGKKRIVWNKVERLQFLMRCDLDMNVQQDSTKVE